MWFRILGLVTVGNGARINAGKIHRFTSRVDAADDEPRNIQATGVDDAVCLEAFGTVDVPNAIVIGQACEAAPRQQWRYLRDSQLLTVGFENMCLNVDATECTDGAEVNIVPCQVEERQQWHWKGNLGQRMLVNNKCAKCLKLQHGAGSGIALETCDNSEPRQHWNYGMVEDYGPSLLDVEQRELTIAIAGTEPHAIGSRNIQALGFDDVCLESSGGEEVSDPSVIVRACAAASAQQWSYHPDMQTLTVGPSDMCLSVRSQACSDGAEVEVSRCNGDAIQRWRWIGRKGKRQLVNHQCSRCLDVQTSGGSVVTLEGCNTIGRNLHQHWNFGMVDDYGPSLLHVQQKQEAVSPMALEPRNIQATGLDDFLCLKAVAAADDIGGFGVAVSDCGDEPGQQWLYHLDSQSLTFGNSQLCLDAECRDDSSHVRIAPCGGGATMQWRWTGNMGMRRIRNQQCGTCLTVQTEAGNAIALRTCQPSDERQHWNYGTMEDYGPALLQQDVDSTP